MPWLSQSRISPWSSSSQLQETPPSTKKRTSAWESWHLNQESFSYANMERRFRQRGRYDSVVVDSVSVFRDEWEEEFQKSQFQTKTIWAACCIGAAFFTFQSVMQLIAGTDGEAGTFPWFFLTWTPQLLCGILYAGTALLFSLPSRRGFCMRHYDTLCAITIVASCFACVATYLLVEIRRALFQNPEYPNIQWGVDYSHVRAHSCPQCPKFICPESCAPSFPHSFGRLVFALSINTLMQDPLFSSQQD